MYITPKWLIYRAPLSTIITVNYLQILKTPDFNKKPSVLLAFYVDYNDIFMWFFVALG
jgi:hypothetical protein